MSASVVNGTGRKNRKQLNATETQSQTGIVVDVVAEAREALSTPEKTAATDKAQAKESAKRKAREAMEALRKLIAANDAKLAESSKAYSSTTTESARLADDILSSVVNGAASYDKIRGALRDAALVGRLSSFDNFRLQCGLIEAGYRRAFHAERTKAGSAKSLPKRVKAAVKESLAHSAADIGERCDARRAGVMLRAGYAVQSFGWLRGIAETSKAPLSAFCQLHLSPFVAVKLTGEVCEFGIFHPTQKGGKSGKARVRLAAEDEGKLRAIVAEFAAGKLTNAEAADKLRAAGLKTAKAARKTPSKAKGDASHENAPTSIDYAKLGESATPEQAKAFILAWAKESARSDLATTTAIAKAIADGMTA